MAIYIDWEGIKGNVTAEGFEDLIAVDSFSFGVGRSLTMEVGNCANREASRPAFSEITLTKESDNSCISIFKEASSVSDGKTMVIKFVQTGSALKEYMTYELKECLVSGYTVSANAEGNPIESISISFTDILVSYTTYDSSNKAGSPERAGYNLKTAAVV